MSSDQLTGDRDRTDPLLTLLPGGISAATLLVAFSLMAIGFDQFWIAFPIGFGVVLPTAVGFGLYAHATDGGSDEDPDVRPSDDVDDALETLRRRYARGELSETEFERRVERLLETEPAGLHDDSITPTAD